ncbi:hypothetical protein BGZ58_010838 [Dissophora ornata]|nr:hypothetical protein BGZ58_010838 [Dissophora ornata]
MAAAAYDYTHSTTVADANTLSTTAAQEHHRVSIDQNQSSTQSSDSDSRRVSASSLCQAEQQQQQRQQQQQQLQWQDHDLPRISLDQPPPYSLAAGNNGSTLIATARPPTEEQLFQVQELTFPSIPTASGNGGSSSLLSMTTATTTTTSTATTTMATPVQHQFICANPMHDQQYLLVGSGNALHSIDLTLPAHKQSIRTHIQGLAFKEIHCLEDVGLVVVIAGRNSRVRCYNYDAIMRLVSYGHSKEGRGRVVEGGKLGPMKNMIQLRVETAFLKDDGNNNQVGGGTSPDVMGSTNSSPGIQSRTRNIFKGGSSPSNSPSATPQLQLPHNRHRLNHPQHQHQHSHSVDRSLLSPPVRSDSPGQNFECASMEENDNDVLGAPTSMAAKRNKQRPLSFGGLASLAQEHVMKNWGQPQQQQQSSTPISPVAGNGASKNKRLSQVASYLSHAAVSSNMTAHMKNGQDAPSEEAVSWAWDFKKLKQTKDVLGLDFHYTTSTVFMTVLSKSGIDIYCRPKSARGWKAVPWTSAPTGTAASSATASTGNAGSGAETIGRPSVSSSVLGSIWGDNSNPYEWKQFKQFYHPEAPSFMTVVKSPQEVTDFILGKGPRACIINVDTMSVTDLYREEAGNVLIQGIGKKLGFKNSPLWHSFEKIPFDVPPHILYPEAAAAVYGSRQDSKEQYATYGSEQRDSRQDQAPGYVDPPTALSVLLSDAGPRPRDEVIQRPADQQNIHQQQLEEQERAEAEALREKMQQTQLQTLHVVQMPAQSSSPSSSSSSSSSSSLTQAPQQPATSIPQSNATASKLANHAASKKTRMVTSDEVLNMHFCQRTTTQLFLATYGSQSRIVNLQGKAQSPIVLEWESFPPQKVEFLKTPHDIYVVGFEKTSIVVFSLSRAKKVKTILKRDLVRAADATVAAVTTAAGSEVTAGGNGAVYSGGRTSSTPTSMLTPAATSTAASSSNSSSGSTSNNANSSGTIKFLGRDNIAVDSLGIFFSYSHPRNGTSICKLGIVPQIQDDLELIGYYP